MRPILALWLLAVCAASAPGQEATLLPPVESTTVAPAEAPALEQASPATEPAAPRIPEMFGDQGPISSLLMLPAGQIAGRGAIYVPSVRYFKIADNASPRPQTASYFSFNYFYDLNGVINRRAGADIQHIRIHREIWGLELASEDGAASLGLRLPLNTFNAANRVQGLDGTSTDVGDLSVIFKYLLWRNPDSGSLLSAGLAVVAPTGPGSFAGSDDLKVFHHTGLQPFVGWIYACGPLFFQGFTAVDAVADLNDVVMLDNSVAVGYFLYQDFCKRDITAVIPTVEVHVHTPLSHRGVLRLTDPAGSPDQVDITAGVQLEYRDRSSFGVAFATPVVGPRLYDFQILAQWRCRY
jgi:hypothetical protein